MKENMKENTKENKNSNVDLQKLIVEQNIILRQMDWKLWVITNAVCDALLKNGMLEKDPRKPS
jgi:hypothetical protein